MITKLYVSILCMFAGVVGSHMYVHKHVPKNIYIANAKNCNNFLTKGRFLFLKIREINDHQISVLNQHAKKIIDKQRPVFSYQDDYGNYSSIHISDCNVQSYGPIKFIMYSKFANGDEAIQAHNNIFKGKNALKECLSWLKEFNYLESDYEFKVAQNSDGKYFCPSPVIFKDNSELALNGIYEYEGQFYYWNGDSFIQQDQAEVYNLYSDILLAISEM